MLLSWLMRGMPVLLLGMSLLAPLAAAELVSVPVALGPQAVSEAPEGRSDGNWRVENLVDGRWGTPPYYPDQQWMARHISEPGYDIWCHLDLGRPRRLHRIDLGNALLGSFVHLKDLRLEFSDGTAVDLRMERVNGRQSFALEPVTTQWCRIHLVSHYRDGRGIDVNSGGLAEVALYELVDAASAPLAEARFAPGRDGEVTAALVHDRPLNAAAQARPAEGLLTGGGAGSWRLWHATPTDRRAPETGWACFEVECGAGDAPNGTNFLSGPA